MTAAIVAQDIEEEIEALTYALEMNGHNREYIKAECEKRRDELWEQYAKTRTSKDRVRQTQATILRPTGPNSGAGDYLRQ